MTPSELERITIIEPPLRELHKRHSWLASSCLGGLGFLAIAGLGFAIGTKLFLGPGPQEMTRVPPDFPTSSIPIYDQENVERITVIPGRYTTRGIHLSALLPGLIFNRVYTDTADLNNLPESTTPNPNVFAALWTDLRTKNQDYTVTTRFEWQDLDADPNFIRSFYEQALEKRGFIIGDKKNSKNEQGFTFREQKSLIDGSLLLERKTGQKRTGTARAILIVRIPEKPAFLPRELPEKNNDN